MTDNSELFDSLNLYQDAQVLSARTVEDLVSMLKQCQRPIRVIQFVSHAGNISCIFLSDAKIIKEQPKKKTK